jgi:hypothetical protein
MTLTFPTIAEQVLFAFRTSSKTVSITTLAKKHNAKIEYTWPGLTTYIFEDDTSLTVRGRGRAHEIETHLP